MVSVNHFSSDVTVNCLKHLSVGCFAALRGTPLSRRRIIQLVVRGNLNIFTAKPALCKCENEGLMGI